jgi:hypothetical protein
VFRSLAFCPPWTRFTPNRTPRHRQRLLFEAAPAAYPVSSRGAQLAARNSSETAAAAATGRLRVCKLNACLRTWLGYGGRFMVFVQVCAVGKALGSSCGCKFNTKLGPSGPSGIRGQPVANANTLPRSSCDIMSNDCQNQSIAISLSRASAESVVSLRHRRKASVSIASSPPTNELERRTPTQETTKGESELIVVIQSGVGPGACSSRTNDRPVELIGLDHAPSSCESSEAEKIVSRDSSPSTSNSPRRNALA